MNRLGQPDKVPALTPESPELNGSVDRYAIISLIMVIFFAGGISYRLWRSNNQAKSLPLRETSHQIRSDGARQLTEGIGQTSFQNACFSPNSQQLVFTRWRDGYNKGPADLVIRDVAAGTDRILLADNDSANVNVPFGCWRGNRIVFASDRGGRSVDEIWTIEPDGTNLRQLTNHTNPISFIEPVFSPDGQRITFEADQQSDRADESLGQIFILEADGGNPQQLTGSATSDDRLPSWSADGKILFQRRERLADDSWGDWDVMVVTPVSPTQWSVPENYTAQSPAEETDNSWSPDAQFIIASSDYGGLAQPNIFAFPVDGGAPIRLTRSSEHEDGAASISPDGQWLVFESHRTSDEDSPSDLWLMELSPRLDPSFSTRKD